MPIDLTSVTTDEFTPLAPGWYNATIEKSEVRQSKNNPSNHYINLMFDINGKKVFEMLNVKNASEQAQSIALKRAKKILTALGNANFVFRDLPGFASAFSGALQIELDVIHDSYKGKDINIIKNAKMLDSKPKPASVKPAWSDESSDFPF